MPRVVYYSSTSGNTHHFVNKLDVDLIRIPISPKDPMPCVLGDFVLVCPTYAGDDGSGAVPKQVIKFLNDPANRSKMVGVIAGGNKNFGIYYGHAGTVISKKCNVPLLYRFELRGTPKDIRIVQEGLEKLWTKQPSKKKAIA